VTSAVVLDNEAVAALRDVAHTKHRRVLSHLQAAVGRRRRGHPTTVVVPCAVRVEAGWDRSDPGAAAINRFRVADVPLDAAHADLAAAIVTRDQVSVADAHVGAAVEVAGWGDVVVLTSDPDDMRRVCDPTVIRAVRI
jgi:predicted nucleic acid-binding protein